MKSGNPIIRTIQAVQAIIDARAVSVHEHQTHTGCEPNRAVILELNGLIGDLQDLAHQTSVSLRAKGIPCEHVPSVAAIIIQQERENDR
jgi:hypothetical protein